MKDRLSPRPCVLGQNCDESTPIIPSNLIDKIRRRRLWRRILSWNRTVSLTAPGVAAVAILLLTVSALVAFLLHPTSLLVMLMSLLTLLAGAGIALFKS